MDSEPKAMETATVPFYRSFYEQLYCSTLNPVWIGIFRILFASFSCIFALTTYSQVELIWYGMPASTLWTLKLLHVVWAAMSILMLLGVEGLIGRLLHAGLAFVLIVMQDSSYTMNEDFFVTTCFWIIFLDLDQKYSVKNFFQRIPGTLNTSLKSWPIALLFISSGFKMLYAGITKHYDPLWREGYGFYYTFLLPWIKHPSFNFLLDSKSFMLLNNYLAIIVEITFLFFFIFKKTRSFAFVLYLGFALLLIVLRVDFIGPIAFSQVFLMAAMLPKKHQAIATEPQMRHPLPSRLKQWFDIDHRFAALMQRMDAQWFRQFLHKNMVWLLTAWTLLTALIAIPGVIRYAKYPAVRPPLVIMTQQEANNTSKFERLKPNLSANWNLPWQFDWTYKMINRFTTGIRAMALFNAHHTLGIYLYRIEIINKDGTVLEPIQVFNPDKSPGKDSLWLKPRWLQAYIYKLSSLCHKLNAAPEYKPIEQEMHTLERLMQYALLRSGSEDAQLVHLKVAPILVPFEFQGDCIQGKEEDWVSLCLYHPDSDQYKISYQSSVYPLMIPVRTKEDTFIVIKPYIPKPVPQ